MTTPDSLKVVIDSVKLLTVNPEKEFFSVELVSVIVAFLAVIVGPIIQLLIAKKQMLSQSEITSQQIKAQLEANDKQIKSNVLSKNRQEWIHMVRGNISELISTVILLKITKIASKEYDESILNIYEKIFRLESLIKMQLSSDEPEHQEFIIQMKKVTSLASKKKSSDKINDEIEKLTTLAQKIFKEVWEKVKSLQ